MTQAVRYIVFLLDANGSHDGKIFPTVNDAREFARESLEDHYATKFVIGTFVLDTQAQSMSINCIEAYGISGIQSGPKQLDLFS